MKLYFLCLFSILVVFGNFGFAQKVQDKIENQGFGVSDTPLNCEMNLQKLEKARELVRNQQNKKGVLILIARLGDKERDTSLNELRLKNVRHGLEFELGVVNEIIETEGKRKNGFGRVEFYLEGRLIGALLAKRNHHVIKCDL